MLLELKNISACQNQHPVFENLNITIEEGEKVAILGPNGAGKSTLMKLLSREIYPLLKENSYLKILGSETVKVDELRQQIGIVSQDLQSDYNVISTAQEVVVSGFFGAIGLLYQHYPVTQQHYDRALEALAEVGLLAEAKRYFHQLSTGQQRRVLLARALIHSPGTLILDEPSNGLDVKASFDLLNTLRLQCQQGRGLLLCTHHLNEIIPEIDRVLLLKDGVLVEDGPKVEVLKADTLSQLYEVSLTLYEHNGYFHLLPA